MRKIGITGGVGSGKSRVLEYIQGYPGVYTCQADRVAFELQQPGELCYEEILRQFGRDILSSDDIIDRKKLGDIVFQDEEKLQLLNRIVHPLVNQRIEEQIREEEKKGTRCFVLEAALLNHPYYRTILDEIWYVYAEEEVRRERLKQSRGYSEQKIDDIIKSQATEVEFRGFSDRLIDNTGAFEETQKQLDELLKKM